METDGAAATAVANDAAVVSGASQSPLADLFSASSSSTLGDDLGTSTIAIFVLFGASTFAAVGMFFKTWLLEDYRGACLFVLVATQSFVVWFLLLYNVPGSTQLNSTDCSSLHSSVNLLSCCWSIFHFVTGSRSLQLSMWHSTSPNSFSYSHTDRLRHWTYPLFPSSPSSII